jgi:hypothetical protein
MAAFDLNAQFENISEKANAANGIRDGWSTGSQSRRPPR